MLDTFELLTWLSAAVFLHALLSLPPSLPPSLPSSFSSFLAGVDRFCPSKRLPVPSRKGRKEGPREGGREGEIWRAMNPKSGWSRDQWLATGGRHGRYGRMEGGREGG